MTSYRKQNEEIQRLKRDLKDLTLLVLDRFSSQIQINCELNGQLETVKWKLEKLSGLNSKLKLLVDKYKEQRIQMDLLVQLLRGRWKESVCECGRQMTTLSVDKEETSRDHDNETNERRKPPCPINRPKRSRQKDLSNDDQPVSKFSKKQQNVTEKSTQTGSEEASVFTYSADLKKMIGKPLHPYEIAGSALRLYSDGFCEFVVSESPCWNEVFLVMNSIENFFFSKFLVLPDEFHGLIIIIGLYSVSGQNCELKLLAPHKVNQNRNIPLPVRLKLQIEMILNTGDIHLSRLHKFSIDALSWDPIAAKTGAMLIPLGDISEEIFRGGRLRFKFSKY